MIQANFNYKNNALLTLPPITATYGDDIRITLNQHDKYGAVANYGSHVLTLLFSSKSDNALLYTVTGDKSGHVGTFEIDTSDLPSAGDYKYQFLCTDGNEDVYAIGTLKLNSLIE